MRAQDFPPDFPRTRRRWNAPPARTRRWGFALGILLPALLPAAPARAGTDLTCDRRIQAGSCTEYRNLNSAEYSFASKDCTDDSSRRAGRPTTSACPLSKVVALCEGPLQMPERAEGEATQRTRYYSGGGKPHDEEALVQDEYECTQSGGRWTRFGAAARAAAPEASDPGDAWEDPSRMRSCSCNKMSTDFSCVDYPRVFPGGCSLAREKCLQGGEEGGAPGKFSGKACPKSTIHATCESTLYLEGEPVKTIERYYASAGSPWSAPEALGQAAGGCNSAEGTWRP